MSDLNLILPIFWLTSSHQILSIPPPNMSPLSPHLIFYHLLLNNCNSSSRSSFSSSVFKLLPCNIQKYFFLLFRAAPVTHGSSQARGLIKATAASLLHSHSNISSLTYWARPGFKPTTSWFLLRFVSAVPRWELPKILSNHIVPVLKDLHC